MDRLAILIVRSIPPSVSGGIAGTERTLLLFQQGLRHFGQPFGFRLIQESHW